MSENPTLTVDERVELERLRAENAALRAQGQAAGDNGLPQRLYQARATRTIRRQVQSKIHWTTWTIGFDIR